MKPELATLALLMPHTPCPIPSRLQARRTVQTTRHSALSTRHSKNMRHLVEWDQLDVRIDGAKLNAMVASMRVPPIERLGLVFQNGLLRVEGTIRKFVAVPFTVEIRELLPKGMTVRV